MQELYLNFLRDPDFVEGRFETIARQAGIGPRKLSRSRARGKVAGVRGINFPPRMRKPTIMNSLGCSLTRCLSISALWTSTAPPSKKMRRVHDPSHGCTHIDPILILTMQIDNPVNFSFLMMFLALFPFPHSCTGKELQVG